MNALITGAAGFIGSHLTEYLLDGGATVTGIDCFTDYYSRAIKEAHISSPRKRTGFRFVEAQIENIDLNSLLQRITHVFHLAAQPGVRRSWGRDFQIYTSCNIDTTQILLEACVNVPLERFVYASSSSVYGDDVAFPMKETARPQPISPYGVTKLAAEHLCKLYHINHKVPTVSLRYFTVYGPRQRPDMAFHRFIKAAITGNPITLYGSGTQTRDFTYITDTLSATAAAATQGVPGRVYNIGGGSRVSISHVLAMIARCTNRKLDIRCEPTEKGDMRDTYADTTLAETELNFKPTIELEEGIRAEHEWMLNSLSLI